MDRVVSRCRVNHGAVPSGAWAKRCSFRLPAALACDDPPVRRGICLPPAEFPHRSPHTALAVRHADRPISTPASAPSSTRSLHSPRCTFGERARPGDLQKVSALTFSHHHFQGFEHGAVGHSACTCVERKGVFECTFFLVDRTGCARQNVRNAQISGENNDR